MKRVIILAALVSCMFIFNNADAGSGPDYKTKIIGTWKFDLGGGMMATVIYKADGSFTQEMGSMTIAGRYTVKCNKLTTVVRDQTTVFTFHSVEGNKISIKRDKDQRTIVYIKQ